MLAGLAIDEPEGASLADGEAGVVAVAEPIGGRDYRPHGWVGEAADTLEGVDNGVGLEAELGVVVDVLPLTAGTGAEVGAGRVDAAGRGFENFQDAGGDITSAFAEDFGEHLFAGDGSEDKDAVAIDDGGRFAQAAPGIGAQAQLPTEEARSSSSVHSIHARTILTWLSPGDTPFH